jgi:hypothetical protein
MEMSAEAVKVYDLKVSSDGRGIGEDDDRPDLELDRAIRRYMAENGVASYSEAFDAVRADPRYADQVKAYAAS